MDDIKMPAKITLMDVNKLSTAKVNPRTHSEAQIEKIVDSIRTFGWTAPVIADGNGNLLAGHGRLLAAKKLGIAKIPVINIGNLSPEKARAYLIADNQIALNSTWDLQLLLQELDNVENLDMDISSTGFSPEEVSALRNPAKELINPETDPADTTMRGLVVSYKLLFDNEPQQKLWFDFVLYLNGTYQDEETIGARLARFVVDNGYSKDA